MANELVGTITATVQDAKGRKSQCSFYYSAETTYQLGDLVSAGENFAQLVANASKGMVIGVTINHPIALFELGLTNNEIDATSDVEEKLQLLYASIQGIRTSMSVPAIDEAVFIPGERTLDRSTPFNAGEILNEAMLNQFGTTVNPVVATTATGLPINTYIDGYEVFTPSARRRR